MDSYRIVLPFFYAIRDSQEIKINHYRRSQGSRRLALLEMYLKQKIVLRICISKGFPLGKSFPVKAIKQSRHLGQS